MGWFCFILSKSSGLEIHSVTLSALILVLLSPLLQISDFVKEVQEELSKPGFNSFGLGDCKAPKVLGDIVESIAGAIFLDNDRDTSVVWKVRFT